MAALESTDPLVKQLLALLRGGQAHVGFAGAIEGLPVEARGRLVEGPPHSIWQLVEHIRITQRDILNFSAPPTGGYHGLAWPQDYWPENAVPAAGEWERTVAAIEADLAKFEGLLLRPGVDLYKPFLWGDGQNLLREALLIADHTAYHAGEIVLMRRVLGVWNR